MAQAREGLGDAEIRRVLTYSGSERFGSEMLACERLDKEIVSEGSRFQRVLLPVDGEGCEASQYDLVMIANGGLDAHTDVATVLVAAEAFGIDFHLGLPRPGQDAEQPWLIDTSYLDTMTRFTERTVKDWEARYSDLESYGGLYQSSEMPMKGNEAWDAQFALYDAQHGVVAEQAPGSSILVSPYIDARPRMTSPVEAVELFTQRLIDSVDGAHLILAPQDGRGTGKGGVYFPDQADDIVLERLQDVVGGAMTYSDAFGGTTSHDYYTAALESGKAAGGESFELWANIELMEPAPLAGEPICISGVNRGQADSARIATQISVAGDTATKLIGYDWDNAMLCEVPGKDPLVEQLAADEGRPVPTSVILEPGGTALMTGYQLDGVSGVVTWADSNGDEQRVEIMPETSESLPEYGAAKPNARPVDLQAVRFRLDVADIGPSAPWISLALENSKGTIPYGTYSVVPAQAEPSCDTIVTGEHSGPLTIGTGITCIEDATITGPVRIDEAARVLVQDTTIRGPVTTQGADSMYFESSHLYGPLRLQGTTGALTLQGVTVEGPVDLMQDQTGPLGIQMVEVQIQGPLRCDVDTPLVATGLDVRGGIGQRCLVA
ncbi:MAG: hypothetical protein ACTMH5_04750 [Brachybacterium sp.]|uniref:hypothetical protein n=1 Tax=Brachybacterium sp. TaxID=1891286 RepID=UPI003F901156